MSHYDSEFKKFLLTTNINESLSLIDSEFKKDISESNLIDPEELDNSSISKIFNNSKAQIIEGNYEEKKSISLSLSEIKEQNNEDFLSSKENIYDNNFDQNIGHNDKNKKNKENKENKNNDIDGNNKDNFNILNFIKAHCNKELFKKKLFWIITGSSLIAIILIISLVFGLKKDKKENYYNTGIKFQINSKQDSLTQFLYESSEIYETTSKGEASPYIFYTKILYDIYTLNSTYASIQEQKYYKNKYLTTIAINKYCNKLTSKEEDNNCEMKTIFDLNRKEDYNLRRNEEDIDIIKNAILPICLVEHTNTNLIISINCPYTISLNLKNDIIKAFKNIKPSAINE